VRSYIDNKCQVQRKKVLAPMPYGSRHCVGRLSKLTKFVADFGLGEFFRNAQEFDEVMY
jgi:hypothetical protein